MLQSTRGPAQASSDEDLGESDGGADDHPPPAVAASAALNSKASRYARARAPIDAARRAVSLHAMVRREIGVPHADVAAYIYRLICQSICLFKTLSGYLSICIPVHLSL